MKTLGECSVSYKVPLNSKWVYYNYVCFFKDNIFMDKYYNLWTEGVAYIPVTLKEY